MFDLRLRALACYAVFAFAPLAGHAQGTNDVIGVAAPLSGSTAILGEQIVRGSEAAAGIDTQIRSADTLCSAEGGTEAAKRFVEDETKIVLGFLCTESLLAALPVLSEAGIPVIDVGVRANRITDDRERTGFAVWRIAPRSDAEPEAIARTIVERWRNEPFGLIEDGSIANRGLVDTVRRLVADEGLKPAATDNYRPAEEKQFGLVRRLARTGVTRFFIAGDRPDIAVIARDADEFGLDLQIIGAESLLDETSIDQPLPEGVIAVAPPYRYDVPSSEENAREALPGYAGLAYAATQIATAALEEAASSGRVIGEILGEATFETILGPVDFDNKGDANVVRYRPMRWSGEAFVPDAAGETGSGGAAPQ